MTVSASVSSVGDVMFAGDGIPFPPESLLDDTTTSASGTTTTAFTTATSRAEAIVQYCEDIEVGAVVLLGNSAPAAAAAAAAVFTNVAPTPTAAPAAATPAGGGESTSSGSAMTETIPATTTTITWQRRMVHMASLLVLQDWMGARHLMRGWNSTTGTGRVVSPPPPATPPEPLPSLYAVAAAMLRHDYIRAWQCTEQLLLLPTGSGGMVGTDGEIPQIRIDIPRQYILEIQRSIRIYCLRHWIREGVGGNDDGMIESIEDSLSSSSPSRGTMIPEYYTTVLGFPSYTECVQFVHQEHQRQLQQQKSSSIVSHHHQQQQHSHIDMVVAYLESQTVAKAVRNMTGATGSSVGTTNKGGKLSAASS